MTTLRVKGSLLEKKRHYQSHRVPMLACFMMVGKTGWRRVKNNNGRIVSKLCDGGKWKMK